MSNEKTKDWKKVREELEQRLDESEELTSQEDEKIEIGQESALEYASHSDLEEKLTLAEQRAHENWEKLVRVSAELDNIRRRAERDVANAHRYGAEKIISSLLPVADSLEQALQIADKSDGMYEGLELTMKLLLDAFAKQDVYPIDPLGKPFDPQEHEAMSMQEIPGVAANTVTTVFQKGYKLADRVIRPARVIIAKSSS